MREQECRAGAMAGIPKQEGRGFLQQGGEDQRRGWERKKTPRPEGSVVVDVEGLSPLVDSGIGAANTAAEAVATKMILQKTLTRKFSHRGERKSAADGDGLLLPTNNAAGSGGGRGAAAAAAAAPTAAAVTDAPPASPLMRAASVAIVLSPAATSETTATPATATATATAVAASPRPATSCRRAYGRRAAAASPRLGPRRVLLFFATLSSMGTIILLYFTLSMGKMGDGGDANARLE